MQQAGRRRAYVIGGAFTILAGLTAGGTFGGDVSARTLAVLTLTLAAIIWYTAFTYVATCQARESGRLTQRLADLELIQLQAQRAATLPRLRGQLSETRDRLHHFLGTEGAKGWADGANLANHPGVHPVDRGHVDSTWQLAALQDEPIRNSVRPLLALLDRIHELDTKIARDANFHLETEDRKESARKLVADTRRAKEETERAIEEVTEAIRAQAR